MGPHDPGGDQGANVLIKQQALHTVARTVAQAREISVKKAAASMISKASHVCAILLVGYMLQMILSD